MAPPSLRRETESRLGGALSPLRTQQCRWRLEIRSRSTARRIPALRLMCLQPSCQSCYSESKPSPQLLGLGRCAKPTDPSVTSSCLSYPSCPSCSYCHASRDRHSGEVAHSVARECTTGRC